MRILNVSAFYEAHGGGIEIVAGNLARALSARGHQCTWAAAALDAVPNDLSVGTLPLAAIDPLGELFGLPMPLPAPAGVRNLWRAVRDHDAVIVHDALYCSSLIALAAARRYRRPHVLLQHIGTIPYKCAALKLAMAIADRMVTRPVLRRVQNPVFISDAVRRQFAGATFLRPPELMFNGVNAARFRPAANAAERKAIRASLAVPDDVQLVLFVGRLVEKKGLETIQAMAGLLPYSQFLLAGGGPINPVSWGLANVRMLGKVTQDRLAQLYRAADALVLPSVGEGYPLVVQEAMASGLSVLCGLDSADADPAAAPYLHGLVVDPYDPDATAARFAERLAALRSIDPAAAIYARHTYDWALNAARMEAMLLAA